MNEGTGTMIRRARIDEARGWLVDCGADEDMVDEASDYGIVREVDRHYVGGWAAFIADGA